jgi:PAS domain S-box-containing protein
MSIGTNAIHVLYVGSELEVVGRLARHADTEPHLLVSATDEVDVAITQLTRAEIDCVVCEYPFPGSAIREFLRRLDDMDAHIPVVVHTAEDPPVSEALYAAIVAPDDGVEALAARILAVVEAREVGVADTPSLGEAAATLLEDANAYVAHVERDGTVRMVNATAAERLGIEQEAVVGRRLDELIDETTATALLSRGRTALDTGTVREFADESGGRHYRGEFAPVSADCFEVVIRDATAEKRTEQAFHEERAFLETVIDAMVDVFFVLDREFSLVRWNDRLTEVSGLDDAELTTADPFSFVAEDQVEKARSRLEEILTAGHVTTELDLTRRDGEDVPYEITGSLVTDEHGEPRYICCLGRDISTRRATQGELDAVIAELERSNAELEQFAYVASHDLKEPLRMIRSYLQLLERRYTDTLDEDAQDFIDFAAHGADRMRQMIDDLLEYSRVGRTDGELEPVDCDQVLHVVQHNLEVIVEEAGATVEVGALPTVMGDRNRLAQLFQNLVSNAIKHSGEGPTTVTVDARRDGDRWVLSVADDGDGIPADRIDRVFNLFYRAETRESTGIGLAISKKIVEYHGGDIWVESTPGEGATFFVALPAESE